MLDLNNIPGINDNVTDEQLKKMMEDLISENKAINLKRKNIDNEMFNTINFQRRDLKSS